MKSEFKVGDLVSHEDFGCIGVITSIEKTGQIKIAWNNGSFSYGGSNLVAELRRENGRFSNMNSMFESFIRDNALSPQSGAARFMVQALAEKVETLLGELEKGCVGAVVSKEENHVSTIRSQVTGVLYDLWFAAAFYGIELYNLMRVGAAVVSKQDSDENK